MKTDVKTLIAALTTERNSLNKAIAVLQELDGGATPVQAVARVVRKSRRSRMEISQEAKDAMFAEMARAKTTGHDTLAKTARRLAREFGVKPNTVQFGWQRWGRTAHGSNGAEVTQDQTSVLTS